MVLPCWDRWWNVKRRKRQWVFSSNRRLNPLCPSDLSLHPHTTFFFTVVRFLIFDRLFLLLNRLSKMGRKLKKNSKNVWLWVLMGCSWSQEVRVLGEKKKENGLEDSTMDQKVWYEEMKKCAGRCVCNYVWVFIWPGILTNCKTVATSYFWWEKRRELQNVLFIAYCSRYFFFTYKHDACAFACM